MLRLVLILNILTMILGRYPPNFPHILKSLRIEEAQRDQLKLDAPNLLRSYGYEVELHKITTADGYILETHRILPRRTIKSKPVVLAMHGLLASSANYIIQGPKNALGCILADKGYDVWLGNNRGNYYSRAHVQLNPNRDDEFWNYSWDEIGRYDIAALTDYILDVTKQKQIHYIGHSQGATAFLVLNSLRPEYKNKFKSFLAMAPAVYFYHNKSPYIKSIVEYESLIKIASDFSGIKEIAPHNCELSSLSMIESIICTITKQQDLQNVNPALLPLIKVHNPAGASIRQFVHYAQIIKFKSFQRMNFDVLTNLYLYNSITPPAYEIRGITVPTTIFMGISDVYVKYQDLIILADDLPNATIHQIEDPAFGHSGFFWHEDAKRLVYDDIVELLELYEAGLYKHVTNRINERYMDSDEQDELLSDWFEEILSRRG